MSLFFAFVITILIIILSIFLLLKTTLDPFTKKCKSTVQLSGKIVLVTGGNSGIGLETAKDLARRSATVIIASRNVKKSAQAVKNIIATTGNNNVEHKYLNLASFKSIREFVEEFNKDYDRLDILVNNAGCIGVRNEATEDGIDMTMQINYFGPFLLTNLLLPKLIKSQPSRIVIVSSLAHHLVLKLDINGLKNGWFDNCWTRYCRSKLCNILWMKALAKRLPKSVTVNAVHPGGVRTELFKRTSKFYKPILNAILYLIFITPVEGAQTPIYLSVAEEVYNKSGGYYSSCKPNWMSFLVKDDLVEKVWEQSLEVTKSEYNRKLIDSLSLH